MIRIVILDIDGTLIDSNDAHTNAFRRAFSAEGFRVGYNLIRKRIGMGGDKLLFQLVGIEEDSEMGRRINDRKSEIFHEEYLPHLKAFPGARALLERIRAEGMSLVVATSAGAKDMKELLKIDGLNELIEDAADKDDVEQSKPDPDVVVAALKKAGCAPEEAVMLGDTPYDAEAARKAGVACIALRCGGWDEARLREAGAAEVYAGPEELLRKFERSLLARERRAVA